MKSAQKRVSITFTSLLKVTRLKFGHSSCSAENETFFCVEETNEDNSSWAQLDQFLFVTNKSNVCCTKLEPECLTALWCECDLRQCLGHPGQGGWKMFAGGWGPVGRWHTRPNTAAQTTHWQHLAQRTAHNYRVRFCWGISACRQSAFLQIHFWNWFCFCLPPGYPSVETRASSFFLGDWGSLVNKTHPSRPSRALQRRTSLCHHCSESNHSRASETKRETVTRKTKTIFHLRFAPFQHEIFAGLFGVVWMSPRCCFVLWL